MIRLPPLAASLLGMAALMSTGAVSAPAGGASAPAPARSITEIPRTHVSGSQFGVAQTRPRLNWQVGFAAALLVNNKIIALLLLPSRLQ